MQKKERILRGIPVSAGFVVGKTFIYENFFPHLSAISIANSDIVKEITRFETALAETEHELKELYEQVKREIGRDLAEFILIQIGLLKDHETIEKTKEFIQTHKLNAEYAYSEVQKKLAAPVAGSAIAFFRERFADILDVTNRVLRNLLKEELPSIHEIPDHSIIITHDLLPSEAALLDKNRVLGVVTETGGKTAHSAIMIKAKEIPAVMGIENIKKHLKAGETIILDGLRGIVIHEPTEKRLDFYRQEAEKIARRKKYLFQLKEADPITQDGRFIDLSANIEFIAECFTAQQYGARGIGLFRTEYLYLAKRRAPTEEEQYQVFAEVAAKMKPYPVIIRTFDLGGDKVIPGYIEANPFLGWRAIRFCFDDKEFFRTNETKIKILPQLPGKHLIVIRAVDKAGNFRESTTEVFVEPLKPPLITKYPKELREGEILTLEGISFYPNTWVLVYIQKEGEKTTESEVNVNEIGHWSFEYDKCIRKGVYKVWAKSKDARGALSLPTEEITIPVTLPIFLKLGKIIIDYLTTTITLIIFLIISAIAVIFYTWYRISLWKKRG